MISETVPSGLKMSIAQDFARRTVYTSESGGSIVSENQKITNEEKDNIDALKAFADKGDKVVLLKTSDQKGVRTADSTINGVLWEVKTNRTPTESAIDTALRSCNGQSKNLVLNLKSGITDTRLISGLKGRIQRTNIQKIIVERNGVIVKNFNRKDLIKKK